MVQAVQRNCWKCPETSVINYQLTLHKNPEERNSQIYGGRSLIPRVYHSNLALYKNKHMLELKVKFIPEQATKTKMGSKKYSSTLPLTFGDRRGGWSTPRLGRFDPRKQTLYALYRRLGGRQGWSGRERKNSPPPGFLYPDRPARSQSVYNVPQPTNAMN